MVADGAITESARATAEAEYKDWIECDAESMTMYLEAVEGSVARVR
jgi:hypothetical protein